MTEQEELAEAAQHHCVHHPDRPAVRFDYAGDAWICQECSNRAALADVLSDRD
jgi:hypothetical protein